MFIRRSRLRLFRLGSVYNSIARFGVLLALQLAACSSSAAELRVAVASNFASTASALINQYSQISNDSVVMLVGSTGKHFSQIQFGLEIDVFLAADEQRPRLLEDAGVAVHGSRFTYAVGRLALWGSNESLIEDRDAAFNSPLLKYLAVANPKTAPYGLAATQVLSNLGVEVNLVYGESVGQALQFASSGGAELAFVAYSQVKNLKHGSFWLVPSDLHQPIEQQAVALNNKPAVNRFMQFLKSETALTLIESHGYRQP